MANLDLRNEIVEARNKFMTGGTIPTLLELQTTLAGIAAGARTQELMELSFDRGYIAGANAMVEHYRALRKEQAE
jgi:hypothetical protein